MEHKLETENVPMKEDCGTSVPEFGLPADNSEKVRKIRRNLRSVLIGSIAGSVISLIFTNYQFPDAAKYDHIIRIIGFGEAAFLILFHSFGLWATHRYSVLGLRVFACLFVIIHCARIVLILTGVILHITDISSSYPVIHKSKSILFISSFSTTVSINIVICFIILIAIVLIVSWALKLARLIDANKNIVIQQI